ncbi:hypothetical protein Q2941_28020, partial [Bradyrhizobium sp. UFLA05-153]
FGDPPASESTSKPSPVTTASSHTTVVAVAGTHPAAAPTLTSPPETNVTDHSKSFGDPPASESTSKPSPVTTASSHTTVVAVAGTHPAAAPTPTSPPETNVTDHSTGTGPAHGWWSEYRDSIANGGMTTPAIHTSVGMAGQSSALFSRIGDLVAERGGLNAVTAPITPADASQADGSTTAFLASRGFALLNQHLAGNAGRIDPGQIVSAGSNSTTWAQDSILTRPQH